MRIEHVTVIDAPIDRVWALTMDVSSWPAMSRTFTSVQPLDEGTLRPGSRVSVKQPGQSAKVWTVTTVDDPTDFAWQARVFGVEMVASHHLSADGDRTVNTLSVDLTGRGAGLLGRMLGPALKRSLATENKGLKRYAEAA